MRERKFITESVKKLLVSEYIRKETESAGFGNMVMKRTPFGTNITLHVNKPGLVIGRRGSKIQEITENLEKKFSVESPQIEVKEAENPDLNPQVVSKKIALSLEKGWSYRKAGNTSLRRAVDSDVKGIMIKVSGKLTGERSRTQKFFHGSVKYSGEPGRAAMLNGFSIAKMKQGVIGVTVRILDPDYRLPDEISFSSSEARRVVSTPQETGTQMEAAVEEVVEVEPEVQAEVAPPAENVPEKAAKPKKAEVEEKPAKGKKPAKEEAAEDKPQEKPAKKEKAPEPGEKEPETKEKAPVKEAKKKAAPKKKAVKASKDKEPEPEEKPKAAPKKRGRKPKAATEEEGKGESAKSEVKSEETDGAES